MSVETRFYMPSAGQAEVAPAFPTSWHDTSEALRRPCGIAKTGTAIEQAQITRTSVFSPPQFFLLRQYVSGSILDAVDFGALSYFTRSLVTRARVLEEQSTVVSYLQVLWRVISTDGTIVRGHLNTLRHPPYEAGALLSSTLRNRRFIGGGVRDAVSQPGDRLVAEVGISVGRTAGHPGDVRTVTAIVEFGDPFIEDLPNNDTSQSPGCPWFRLLTPTNILLPPTVVIEEARYHKPLHPLHAPARIQYPSVEAVGDSLNTRRFNE